MVNFEYKTQKIILIISFLNDLIVMQSLRQKITVLINYLPNLNMIYF